MTKDVGISKKEYLRKNWTPDIKRRAAHLKKRGLIPSEWIKEKKDRERKETPMANRRKMLGKVSGKSLSKFMNLGPHAKGKKYSNGRKLSGGLKDNPFGKADRNTLRRAKKNTKKLGI